MLMQKMYAAEKKRPTIEIATRNCSILDLVFSFEPTCCEYGQEGKKAKVVILARRIKN